MSDLLSGLPRVRRMPTVYATGARTLQGNPISDADKAALRAHEEALHPKRVITDKMRAHYAKLHEYSPRTKKREG